MMTQENCLIQESTLPTSPAQCSATPQPDDDNAFAQLGLVPALVEALKRLDIQQPTPVQQQTIPLLLAGRDVIASAPTGTGKTAAFLLPALQWIATQASERPAPAAAARDGRRGAGRGRPRVVHGPQVLVLTPTRELAQQVTKTSQSLSRLLPRTSTVCITGGASYFQQNKALSVPYEILVATPGRLIDQLEGGRIDLSRVRLLVLDEADRMLDMGFADDVIGIAEALPAERQTVCFTATISHDVRNLAGKLLKDPQWLTIERSRENLVPIDDHIVYVDNPGHRHQLLMACLNDTGLGQAIVFTATKRHAEALTEELLGEGFAVEALHGDMSQRDRTRALNRLRHGECKVLVATDVAARGIDVSTITHVINHELPRVAEDYVHRIGRTGRAGASGQAVSFVGREDVIPLHKIEHFIGRHIQVSEFPGLEAEFRPMPRKRPKKKGAAGHGKPAARGARSAAGARKHHASQPTGTRARGHGWHAGPPDAEGSHPKAREGAHRSWAGTRHGHHGGPSFEAEGGGERGSRSRSDDKPRDRNRDGKQRAFGAGGPVERFGGRPYRARRDGPGESPRRESRFDERPGGRFARDGERRPGGRPGREGGERRPRRFADARGADARRPGAAFAGRPGRPAGFKP
ncbi:MAG: DEAD/DEAH box helicase [Lautropia sp.]|nr:DEAD/DEAH box helicase [Lautropia sp.]